MKKRNILRASSALFIFAVLSFLSACEGVFEQYEPVGHLSPEEGIIIVGQPFEVKVLLSSKIKEKYYVVWHFANEDNPYIQITENGVVEVKDSKGNFENPDVLGQGDVTERITTLTFTVQKVLSSNVNDVSSKATKFIIEVRKVTETQHETTDMCVLTIVETTPSTPLTAITFDD